VVSYAEARIMAGADRDQAYWAAVKDRDEKISNSRERMLAALEVYEKEDTDQSYRIFEESKLAYFDTFAAAWRQYYHDIETIEKKYVSVTAQQGPGLTHGWDEQMVRRHPEVRVRGHRREVR